MSGSEARSSAALSSRELLLHSLQACIHVHLEFVCIEPDLAHLIHSDRLKILRQLFEECLIRLQVGDYCVAPPNRDRLLPALPPEVVREVIPPPLRLVGALSERRIELKKLLYTAFSANELADVLACCSARYSSSL